MPTATETKPQGKKIEYTRPLLYAKQEAAIFSPARFSFIEASTKSGKTVGCIAWILELALKGGGGKNYWWVAPVYGVAEIAYRRFKRYLPRSIYEFNESKLTITLANGATIWFKGGDKPDTLYGEDVYATVVDEASRCKEDVWTAIRSTLTYTKGPARIIGNVKGRKNWFYRLARKAEAKSRPDWEYHRITAYDAVDAGVLDHSEIDDARESLPEMVFREMYEAVASDDGGNPFGLNHIKQCLAPMSSAPPYRFGWDFAKSQDWTVGIGLDLNACVCAFQRFQKPWTETVEKVWEETANVPALVDSTGVGDPILEFLQKKPAKPKIITKWVEGELKQVRKEDRFSRSTNFEGFLIHSTSKQMLMEGLVVAVQHQRIRFPDGVIRNELESFEYNVTKTGTRYEAPEGIHDDCVVALALAYWHFSHAMPTAAIF